MSTVRLRSMTTALDCSAVLADPDWAIYRHVDGETVNGP